MTESSAEAAATSATAEPAPRAQRLVGLVGPRGLGALLVVLGHTWALTAPDTADATHVYVVGQVITYFFVLSGFLIFLPYVDAAAAGRRAPDLRRYAGQRVRRVMPAYLVIYLIANLVLGAVYVTNVVTSQVPRTDAGTGRVSDPLAVLGQVSLVANLVPSQLQTGISPSWSLTTEIGFYLIVPVFGWWAARLIARPGRSIGWALVPAGVLLVVGLATKALLEIDQMRSGMDDAQAYFGPTWQAVLTRSTLGQADGFAWGIALAVVHVGLKQGRWPAWDRRRLSRWCGTAIVASGVLTLVCIKLTSRFDSSFIAIAFAGLVLLTVEPAARRRPVGRVAAFMDWTPVRLLGEISLSIYLWHYPVLVMCVRAGWMGDDSVIGATWSFVLVAAITVVLSSVTYLLIERPAMTSRSPRARA